MTKANPTNRRDFLRGAVATSALLMTSRPASAAALWRPQRTLPPVKVARNRVIREVVGLRPFRPSGFVVSAERLGEKFLVHNYGHGGGGVTLSWGTATLAVDLLRDFIATRSSSTRRQARSSARPLRFAVVGCGVSGLSTARLLQQRFQNAPGTVTIYAKDLPPNTTSNIAGASWSPTSVFDSEQLTAAFNDQFHRACQISNRAFQLLIGNEYGVRWIPTYELWPNKPTVEDELPGGNALYPQIQIHTDPERFFGFPYVREFTTMLIEPSVYLSALLRDFYIAGGRVVSKEFHAREEIMRLPQNIIFNCSGLGARALFGDEQLRPVRGQLEVLLPQPEIDYCYLSRGYMFPRRDGIILGGTWDHDDWNLSPNPEQANWILETHSQIMNGIKP